MTQATVPPEDSTDADLALADTPLIAKLAASATAMSGLLVGLSGLQLVAAGLRSIHEWVEMVPKVLMLMGFVQIVLAAMVFRSRGWAVLAGLVHNGLTAIAQTGWLIYSLSFSVSLLALGAVPFSGLALLLIALSIPAVRRTSAARARLAESGLGLGL